jgi:hypothetical protein
MGRPPMNAAARNHGGAGASEGTPEPSKVTAAYVVFDASSVTPRSSSVTCLTCTTRGAVERIRVLIRDAQASEVCAFERVTHAGLSAVIEAYAPFGPMSDAQAATADDVSRLQRLLRRVDRSRHHGEGGLKQRPREGRGGSEPVHGLANDAQHVGKSGGFRLLRSKAHGRGADVRAVRGRAPALVESAARDRGLGVVSGDQELKRIARHYELRIHTQVNNAVCRPPRAAIRSTQDGNQKDAGRLARRALHTVVSQGVSACATSPLALRQAPARRPGPACRGSPSSRSLDMHGGISPSWLGELFRNYIPSSNLRNFVNVK